ncbi:hypothetical protein Trydic_g2042 [Trypoxylus dichotomus]
MTTTMGRQKYLTLEEIEKTKALHQESYSARTTAKKLGRSHQTASSFVKDPEDYERNLLKSAQHLPQQKENVQPYYRKHRIRR